MIPPFPQFKKLEISDKDDIESLTAGFDPYSDFSFITMWLWRQRRSTLLSKLNGNLVALLSDIRKGASVLSFIGENDPNGTAMTLLEFALAQGLPPDLGLVPEVCTMELSRNRFHIIEDRDNSDYLFATAQLAEMAGRRFSKLRTYIGKLERRDCEFRHLQLNDRMNQAILSDFATDWNHKKQQNQPDNAWEVRCLQAETVAFNRVFLMPRQILRSLQCFGLFVDGELAAFCVGEVTGQFFVCHFGKHDYKWPGVDVSLFQRLARNLCRAGVNFINDQEDLGIPGLRFHKNRFRPSGFLKKFCVTNLT